ncbi:FAD-dependent oxidoreductase [Corynebacterium felinum]|uniref:Glycine/D-amino acid oxidase-like deaminating enzyme n=1 Tax=Corynebacterium felinum TaxID=131318 RepID=A0ABU2B9J2_9CORY|nr:FAD-dependent oxidoreductase [Corynebacterium felinum]MDF5821702.1 FAD-dependent oxidoreductase [Corynebacterium felinum]MDR7355278.1 glycine/D-amino acid oxidase-like deaminating enzyme [Corynebacterium felinum]WJY94631.1 Gamma-glutamylputrescine oxidoreductase [Corynebacterium felinum]
MSKNLVRALLSVLPIEKFRKPTPLTSYSQRLQHDSAMLAAALAEASSTPFWLDSEDRPAARLSLSTDLAADLVVVGGGFCGLWTALIAKQRHPEWEVVLLEKRRIAWAASGRNGGFCEAELTHGEENGRLHFADELNIIRELAAENFAALERTIEQFGIDAEYENTGVMVVATEPHQVPSVTAKPELLIDLDSKHGHGQSPLYLAAMKKLEGYSFVHPAKLAWGLADAASSLGVKIYENTKVTELEESFNSGAKCTLVHTPEGVVTAKKVALATNVFPALVKKLQLFTVPIYDYALVTDPLTQEQLESIDWTKRNGITDSGKEFHYYRKTQDNRILFGGWDAVYHFGRQVKDSQDQSYETFMRLADHFYSTFPALKGVRFSHAWGGAIDMSTQLVAFHWVNKQKTIAYSAGYTGLGVCATRFGAETMLDLLEGLDTPRTRLKMANKLPIPIPPEPLTFPLTFLMRRAVQKSDANGGKDGLLLRIASFFKIGFDS